MFYHTNEAMMSVKQLPGWHNQFIWRTENYSTQQHQRKTDDQIETVINDFIKEINKNGKNEQFFSTLKTQQLFSSVDIVSKLTYLCDGFYDPRVHYYQCDV